MARIARGLAVVAVALVAFAACASAGRQEESHEGLWFLDPRAFGGPVSKWTPPTFCYKKDCPQFSVKETADDIELRTYTAARWISTNITDTKFDDAWKEGEKRLDQYFKGDNDKGTKMDETLPHLVILYPAPTGATFTSAFTVEYFVPFELQDAPPKPKQAELAVMHVPQQDVWVKTFGGFADEASVTKEAFDFLDNLQKQGKKVSRAAIGFAQYDPITTLINRHNEIWIWPEAQPTTAV